MSPSSLGKNIDEYLSGRRQDFLGIKITKENVNIFGRFVKHVSSSQNIINQKSNTKHQLGKKKISAVRDGKGLISLLYNKL